MAKTGAKGKYNPEIVETICNLIKTCSSAKDACMAVGINQDTYYEWLKHKPEFTEKVHLAEGERKAALLAKIRKDPSWQSAAWLLSRIYRSEFADANVYELNQRLDSIEAKLAELGSKDPTRKYIKDISYHEQDEHPSQII